VPPEKQGGGPQRSIRGPVEAAGPGDQTAFAGKAIAGRSGTSRYGGRRGRNGRGLFVIVKRLCL